MRILIIGAGSHGQVVADTLLQMQAAGSAVQLIGFLDDDPSLLNKEILGIPILGSESNLDAIEHDAVIIAIGHNLTRQKIYQKLAQQGENMVTAQHPKAIIAPDVKVGPGCMVMAGVIVNTGSTIAENTILNTACTIDHHCQIAAHVHIAPGVHLGGEVVVKEGALVGIGATVMPRCVIGSWAVAGAASLVRRDVPDYKTVVGVPARAWKGN